VVAPEQSPAEAYESRIVLCKQCCEAFNAESNGGIYTIEELEDMLGEEESGTPAEETVAGMSLQDLAAHFNQANTESKPIEASTPDEAPKSNTVPQGVPQEDKADDVPAISAKAAKVAALRKEAEALHAEAQKLYEQADLIPAASAVLRDAARKLDKQSKAKEQEAAAMLEPSVKYYASKEMVALRHAIFLGGVEAVQAFNAAMASGLLGKKAPAKKVDSPQKEASSASTPKPNTGGDNAERNAQIIHLKAQGFTDLAIMEKLGMDTSHGTGLVSGVVWRYNKAKKEAGL